MNVSYIYINIAAFLCFALMFVAFCAAERSREMRAWLVLLGDLVLWTAERCSCAFTFSRATSSGIMFRCSRCFP